MNIQTTPEKHTFAEVNLKILIYKIFKNKFLFIVSILLCLSAAYTYLKIATPKYLVQTSILIDSDGKSRSLGSSKYVDGGVGLIGMEKNLFNEVGILKSYSLVNKTLEDLDFGVSYFAGTWYKKQEYYNYFPFEVKVAGDARQLFGQFFTVKILNDDEYDLSIKANEFTISNPTTNTHQEVTRGIDFSKKYRFGELVEHDYFQFILEKPADDVVMAEFEGQELFFKINSLAGLTNSFINKMKVEQVDIQASILTIQTEGTVVEKEKRFLQKLSENFIQNKFLERADIASSKENFIQKQLDSVSVELADAERNLQQFKSGTNSVDLTRTGSLSLDQLQKMETEKSQINLNLKYYNSLLQYISQNNGIEKAIAPSAAGIDDPLLNENLLELKRLNAQKIKMSFIKGSKSIDLKLLVKQIANTTNSLKENVKSLVRSSNIALKDIDQKIGKLELVLNQLPVNEKKLLNYERKANLYGNLYNYLSQELAKNNIARAENTPDVKVLDEPRQMGSSPIAPQKMLILLLGGIVGVLLPLAWIAFSSSENDTIDNINHLDGRTKFPVAAKIFHAKKPITSLQNFEEQWQVKESFRDLAANLQFLVSDASKNVIGISSTISGEGKTFCASNLGRSLAMEGKKVVLLDLNFRNPKLWEQSDKFQGNELSEYLTRDDISPEEIIYSDREIPYLSFVPTHAENINPHKLLSNVKLKTLIEALKFEFDYIIIDSSPVGLVSDYLLISKYIDIHLFTIRRKMSRFSFLNDLEKLSYRGNIENAFLIFNDEKNRKAKNKYAPKSSENKANPFSAISNVFQKQKTPSPNFLRLEKGNR